MGALPLLTALASQGTISPSPRGCETEYMRQQIMLFAFLAWGSECMCTYNVTTRNMLHFTIANICIDWICIDAAPLHHHRAWEHLCMNLPLLQRAKRIDCTCHVKRGKSKADQKPREWERLWVPSPQFSGPQGAFWKQCSDWGCGIFCVVVQQTQQLQPPLSDLFCTTSTVGLLASGWLTYSLVKNTCFVGCWCNYFWLFSPVLLQFMSLK